MPADDELIELVEKISARMCRLHPRKRDEFRSAGLVGLAKAIRTFDPSRSGNFEALASKAIRSEILESIRAARPLGYRSDADRGADARGFPGDEPITSATSSASDGAPAADWHCQYQDWVQWLSRKLPPRHGEVIRRHYLEAECETFGGLAKAMGMSGTGNRVRQLHDEAIEMLRERFSAHFQHEEGVHEGRNGGISEAAGQRDTRGARGD